jgi:hypothetical protein
VVAVDDAAANDGNYNYWQFNGQHIVIIIISIAERRGRGFTIFERMDRSVI